PVLPRRSVGGRGAHDRGTGRAGTRRPARAQQAERPPRDGGAGHAHRPARDHRAPGARPPPALVEGVHAQAAHRGCEEGRRGARQALWGWSAVRRRPGQPAVTALADAVAAVEAGQGAARSELETLVRIPSISADPDRRNDVQASAEATADLLRAHGLESVRLAGVEGSQPYVLGEWMHA